MWVMSLYGMKHNETPPFQAGALLMRGVVSGLCRQQRSKPRNITLLFSVCQLLYCTRASSYCYTKISVLRLKCSRIVQCCKVLVFILGYSHTTHSRRGTRTSCGCTRCILAAGVPGRGKNWLMNRLGNWYSRTNCSVSSKSFNTIRSIHVQWPSTQ